MVYAKFGGQTECIMGNWKIENFVFLERSQSLWTGARCPTVPLLSINFVLA